ncbi:MAG: hypothetical protein A3F10_05695 [Coxiella sp. RIFCSPHIGHO2_12_FULL_42_15]|nr:MAG: hypothetical protein A3F10_05695 [Coxiella sp. RIFCSPHIGHO2_12_FULL_42_15]
MTLFFDGHEKLHDSDQCLMTKNNDLNFPKIEFKFQTNNEKIYLNYLQAKIFNYYLFGVENEEISRRQKIPLSIVASFGALLCQQLKCKNPSELIKNFKGNNLWEWHKD